MSSLQEKAEPFKEKVTEAAKESRPIAGAGEGGRQSVKQTAAEGARASRAKASSPRRKCRIRSRAPGERPGAGAVRLDPARPA